MNQKQVDFIVIKLGKVSKKKKKKKVTPPLKIKKITSRIYFFTEFFLLLLFFLPEPCDKYSQIPQIDINFIDSSSQPVKNVKYQVIFFILFFYLTPLKKTDEPPWRSGAPITTKEKNFSFHIKVRKSENNEAHFSYSGGAQVASF